MSLCCLRLTILCSVTAKRLLSVEPFGTQWAVFRPTRSSVLLSQFITRLRSYNKKEVLFFFFLKKGHNALHIQVIHYFSLNQEGSESSRVTVASQQECLGFNLRFNLLSSLCVCTAFLQFSFKLPISINLSLSLCRAYDELGYLPCVQQQPGES